MSSFAHLKNWFHRQTTCLSQTAIFSSGTTTFPADEDYCLAWLITLPTRVMICFYERTTSPSRIMTYFCRGPTCFRKTLTYFTKTVRCFWRRFFSWARSKTTLNLQRTKFFSCKSAQIALYKGVYLSQNFFWGSLNLAKIYTFSLFFSVSISGTRNRNRWIWQRVAVNSFKTNYLQTRFIIRN